jgi:hypothetical protein
VEEFFEPVHLHVTGKELEWEWAKKNWIMLVVHCYNRLVP